MKLAVCLILALLAAACHAGETIPFAARTAGAPGGAEVARKIAGLPLAEREAEIAAQVAAGNVPEFLRRLAPVTVTRTVGGREVRATFFVAPDYLAVGSDGDFFLAPLSPGMARKLAEAVGCTLPTRRMVDDIYAAAALKLAPAPLPPGPEMTTVGFALRHNEVVAAARRAELGAHPWGALVAGHKKDVVQSPRLASAPGKVAIYGWHKPGGVVIQPLYLGHTEKWVDYSHGIRFIAQKMTVDGAARTVAEVLADPALHALLSDEGAFGAARFGEVADTFTHEPEVRIHVLAPSRVEAPVRLVIYALPNGNTIEQTLGRKLAPGDDWHFDIQHIAAQARFLRANVPGETLVLACVEARGLSWPAWRKKHGNAEIPGIIEAVRARFAKWEPRVTLAGHSGGGSFIFGAIECGIPADVSRIAFLDATYAYDPAKHGARLTEWLAMPGRHLCVLAYHDDVARLNGKAFVSEKGGTWYRSRLMRGTLAERFPFTTAGEGDLEKSVALEGRAQFLLLENPRQAILHTVQVEKNGFIQAMLSGTPHEGRGYRYFGPRAYGEWVEGE